MMPKIKMGKGNYQGEGIIVTRYAEGHELIYRLTHYHRGNRWRLDIMGRESGAKLYCGVGTVKALFDVIRHKHREHCNDDLERYDHRRREDRRMGLYYGDAAEYYAEREGCPGIQGSTDKWREQAMGARK
jgi:hypothetical protein